MRTSALDYMSFTSYMKALSTLNINTNIYEPNRVVYEPLYLLKERVVGYKNITEALVYEPLYSLKERVVGYKDITEALEIPLQRKEGQCF